MQITSNGYENANVKALENATLHEKDLNPENKKELTLDEQIEKSAVEVTLSMGAQIILDILESQSKIKESSSAQKDIIDFLSGKVVSEDFNLANTGYEGKPITELSKSEALELVGEDGFFGVEKTAQRVADFVLGFAGNDLENLEKSREGVVQGFDDAQKMWGGELPQISHDTQKRTLELIDARIAELKGDTNTTAKNAEVTNKVTTQVDISV